MEFEDLLLGQVALTLSLSRDHYFLVLVTIMAWLASNLPIEQVSYQQLIAQQENLLVLDYCIGLFLALVTQLFSNNLL